MEEQQQKKKMKRKIRIMKKKQKTLHRRTLFPLLLASICSESHNRRAVIKKCLNKVLLSLHHVHLSPILSLLPSLLKFNCAEIVCKSAEIIGAASLASFEMNEKIAMEDEIVKALISLLRSSRKETATAACNAMLDLSTTSVGQQRLLEFSAIENLILCFIQEVKSPAATFSSIADVALKEDEYPILILQAAISLINSCTIEQLQHIPWELSEKFSAYLKRLWGQAYKQRLCSSSLRFDQGNQFYISNIGTNNLAESIFRLSMTHGLHQELVDFHHVKKSIFSLGEVSIEQFFSEIWEISPMLISNASKASLGPNIIFNPFIQYLGSKEGVPSFIPSMLKRIISCPAIASDEPDILHVIKEIKNHLGHPIIYSQDIRVVKSESGERDLHYFQEQSGSSSFLAPHIFSLDDILKCEEAFKEGYSIALRGMEFRYQTIAAIADGLASLFGQPSAGVNMYLTPANSQGLARHSDDHCVFVCQLIGVKRWTVFPRPDWQLPRLYEPSGKLDYLEDESREVDGCRQFLLKEGDVLYVPRGFPHEARTGGDDDKNGKNATGFSLHLTLAIEIEPPFEWEGFMHIALYCWDKQLKPKSGSTVPCGLHIASVELLHISIKLISNLDPAFRKACLFGATPSSADTEDFLRNKQTTIFKYLISRIATESKFSDAVKHLEAALQKDEDPLDRIRWIKYLKEDGDEIERSQSILVEDNGYWFDLLIQDREVAEGVFMELKSKFCDESEFEDVEECYKVVLEKYRTVRKQYTNGMLSLHSAILNEHGITSC